MTYRVAFQVVKIFELINNKKTKKVDWMAILLIFAVNINFDLGLDNLDKEYANAVCDHQ